VTTPSETLQERDTMPRPIGWSSLAKGLVSALIVLGAILRIARWFHGRSFWLDEIYLANSVVTRSLHDLLFHPLEDWQAAPPGFLVIVHVFGRIFGMGERSLRLTSIPFGLASLPLMLAVAKRVLRTGGVLIAMAAFCFLGPLIYYSDELKPYCCDVVVSLAITLATLSWMDEPRFNRAVVLAAVGAVGVYFSFPAIFVLAGAGIWILARQRISRNPAALTHAWIIFALWLAAFALDYLIFLRPFASGEAHPHLVQYWVAQNAFMPHSPIYALRWIFADLGSIARNPGGMWLDYPDAALIGLIIGATIALRQRGKLLLLLAPLPIVLLASAIKQYPFGDRLALFFVPQYLLLIAAGVELLWTNLAGKAAAVAIAGCIIIPSADRAMGYLMHSPGREESLAAYRWVAGNYQPDDVIYLTQFAEPSFKFYRSQSNWPAGFDDEKAVYTQPGNMQPSQIIRDVQHLAGRKRVWVVLIHAEGGDFSVAMLTKSAFDQIGRPVMTHSEPGAAVYLYDCTAADSPLSQPLNESSSGTITIEPKVHDDPRSRKSDRAQS